MKLIKAKAIALITLIIITCLTIAIVISTIHSNITSTANPITIDSNQNTTTFTTATPEPDIITPKPTPTTPYKIIPRNSTYSPSKPLIEPINPNHNYSIAINPPFDNTEPTVSIPQGTIFEISGTTNLPVGTELMVQVNNGALSPTKHTSISCPIDTISDGTCTNGTGSISTIYVEPSNNTTALNSWKFIIDSQMLRPDEYVIAVCSINDYPHKYNKNTKNTDNSTLVYIYSSEPYE